MNDPLSKLRNEIDLLDSEVVDLLNRRARLAQQIGEIKKARRDPLYSPERERSVLVRLKSLNGGPIPGLALDRIYREIMASALLLEHGTRYVTGGISPADAEKAVTYLSGSSARFVTAASTSEIFETINKDPAITLLIAQEWLSELSDMMARNAVHYSWSGCLRLSPASGLIHLYQDSSQASQHERPARALIMADSANEMKSVSGLLAQLPVEYAERLPGASGFTVFAQLQVSARELEGRYRDAMAGCRAVFHLVG